jgi:hypothetical protein
LTKPVLLIILIFNKMKKKNKLQGRFPAPIYPSGNISGKTKYHPTQETWWGTLNYITGAGDDPTVVTTSDPGGDIDTVASQNTQSL